MTDVDGLVVGNAVEASARTGVTVVLAHDGAAASVDVRGGAPGTRETDLLDPSCHVQRIDGICLSGGSAHGLGACDGVMEWLHERDRGLSIGPWHMPIVPGAIIYDLGVGGERDRGRFHGYGALAQAACDSAGPEFELGNAGAGMGACAGRLKGGLGSASAASDDGLTVAALVVANPVGATVMPGSGTLWAWALEQNGEMGHQHPPPSAIGSDADLPVEARIGGNTTLAVVATNANLDKAQCKRMAIMAHDGLARAIRPVHTPFDGDVVFALSTERLDLGQVSDMALARIGAIAADCLCRAIGRAVFEAEPLGGFPSYRESHRDSFADG